MFERRLVYRDMEIDVDEVTVKIPFDFLQDIVNKNVSENLSWRNVEVHDDKIIREGKEAIIKRKAPEGVEDNGTFIIKNGNYYDSKVVKMFMFDGENAELRFSLFKLKREFDATDCPNALLKVKDYERRLNEIDSYTSDAEKQYDIEQLTWFYELSKKIGDSDDQLFFKAELEDSKSLPVAGEQTVEI